MTLVWAEPAKMVQQWNTEQLWHRIEARQRTDTDVHIAVVDGRVAVSTDRGNSILSAGDALMLMPDGTLQQVHDPHAVDALTAWTKGWLDFERMPLQEAVPILARWYDLQIRVADSALLRQTITASFRDEPASTVLQSIADALGAHVVRQGNTVTFTSR